MGNFKTDSGHHFATGRLFTPSFGVVPERTGICGQREGLVLGRNSSRGGLVFGVGLGPLGVA